MAATVVCALAASHGPLLSTPPDKWDLRAGFDRQNPRHHFRGNVYDFESLLAHRRPGYAEEAELSERMVRHERTQHALDELRRRFREAKPDVVIIFGNDQRELLHEELTPALLVFTGKQIENVPFSPAARAALEPGLEYAERGHTPEGGAVYAGAPEVATTIVETLIDEDFDVSVSEKLPLVDGAPHGIPHAFGFLYRRIMEDAPPPSVPIFSNIGCPPNILKTKRCLALGHSVKKAIDRLPDGMRVAVISSGGLSHFTIDEEFDRDVMDAMKAGDEARLAAFPEPYFRGNTCETKSWYPTVAMMNDYGRRIRFVDYVPCYRTAAGTGQAMAFAYWE
jgi:hypothetical protein